jgi:hypothetical protein
MERKRGGRLQESRDVEVIISESFQVKIAAMTIIMIITTTAIIQ